MHQPPLANSGINCFNNTCKMDFLTIADIRPDPLLATSTKGCDGGSRRGVERARHWRKRVSGPLRSRNGPLNGGGANRLHVPPVGLEPTTCGLKERSRYPSQSE